MISPAELSFAVVILTVAKWSMRAGAFRSRCVFHLPEVICLGIFFIFSWVVLPLGHKTINPLHRGSLLVQASVHAPQKAQDWKNSLQV